MWRSKTSGLTLKDLYDTFTILRDYRSDDLIINDLEYLFPKVLESYSKWKENYKNVLNKARSCRDDYAKDLLKCIDLMYDDCKLLFFINKIF